MVNAELVKRFEQIADLLEIKGEDRFRINSYRRAARAIDDLTEDVAALAERDELETVPGIGKSTAERIRQFLAEGRITLHEELMASLPAGLLKVMSIPGLGPKKVGALYHELGVGSIEDLQVAIAAGKVEQLSGFGAKSVAKIQEGIGFLARSAGRTPLGVGYAIAESLRSRVAALPGVKRVIPAGSLRRGRETLGDIDLLCEAADGQAVIDAFSKLPEVSGVRASGDTKASILVASPEGGDIQVDLRVLPAESFGAALQYFTGSKEHNVRLREIAIKKGCKLNEYGLFKGEKLIAGKEEAEIYAKLGLPFIPPELREDRGELERELPKLIELTDIRGDLHMHTTASDGRNSIEEMAKAAKERGYSYIAVTEHSRSSAIAGGLSIEDLKRHIKRIRAADGKVEEITVLAGIECDILSDGALDYPDELLAQLDWVIASIHAAQGQDRARVTARTIAAMENPYVNVIGHPSGRLLGRRDAMDLDWEALFKAAAKTGTAMEVSASWQRLDLKDVHIRQAIEAGCRLCIDTDAHDTNQLDQLMLGIVTARRGWATAEDVVNTWPLAKLKKWIAAKRK
ncbi:MAG TPA: DNA polymerase/3'-5' exonuclease PolX [Phycisphaerae bacterium]|nr:DNA polymerase/3'-5' exonuclease PolX [Phycisphaerae bacterium]HRY70263.1 DNA polymerase/3'-5' exonuclease PolX [Phycisphaerae bacterium]HSA27566.1 DNA polymerase/3'-5' exonuclease PolX [Phycisphaerae bacterium]